METSQEKEALKNNDWPIGCRHCSYCLDLKCERAAPIVMENSSRKIGKEFFFDCIHCVCFKYSGKPVQEWVVK